MPSDLSVSTRLITRNKLAQFLKNHELIKAFENLQTDVADVLPAMSAEALSAAEAAMALADLLASLGFIMAVPATTTPNARALAVGAGLTLTDGGAGNSVVLNLATSGFGAVLAASISENAGTYINAPGMTLTLEANSTYMVDGVFEFQSDAAVPTVGLGFTLPTGAVISGQHGHLLDLAPLTGPSGAVGGVAAAGPISLITGHWIIKTGATAGAAQLRFKSLATGYAVTLLQNRCSIGSRRVA
jgi:hypothetical protein